MNVPRVLVAAPVSKEAKYILPRYLARVKNLKYPNYSVLLVDNGKDPAFTRWLIRKGIKVIKIPHKENLFESISNARNTIVNYILQHKEYEYLFSIDTDVIIPRNSIKRLLRWKKDLVGFLIHCGFERKLPCVLKDGYIIKQGRKQLSFYSWKEIAKMKAIKKLHKVYSTSVACLMIHRKVFDSGVRFRYTPYFRLGEDIWFWSECNEKGFDFYVDLSTRVPHFNKSKRRAILSLMRKEKKLKKSIK